MLSQQMREHLQYLLNTERNESHSPPSLPRQKRSQNPEAARALRASILVSSGHVSRATRTLLQGGLAQMTPRTRQLLKKLHPQQSSPTPALPSGAPTLTCDPEIVHKLVREYLCNGAAPSYSAWTGELLRALIDDDDCLHGISTLIEDIANGILSTRERDLILTCSLIAAQKSDSGSVRPIAMGEAFYKLAGHYVLYVVKDSLPKLLEPIQHIHPEAPKGLPI